MQNQCVAAQGVVAPLPAQRVCTGSRTGNDLALGIGGIAPHYSEGKGTNLDVFALCTGMLTCKVLQNTDCLTLAAAAVPADVCCLLH